jgi:hypothetical protein
LGSGATRSLAALVFRARVVAPDPLTARTHAPSFVGVARPSARPRCPCVALAGPAAPARGGDSHSLRFQVWSRKLPVSESRFRVGRNRETGGPSAGVSRPGRERESGSRLATNREIGGLLVRVPWVLARSTILPVSVGSARHESDVTLGPVNGPARPGAASGLRVVGHCPILSY